MQNSSSGRFSACSLVGVLFVITLAVTTALTGRPAVAQGGGLVVTPQLVELNSRQRSQVLTLVNRGPEPQTYRISVINLRMEQNGDLIPADRPAVGEGFAGNLIRYAPRQITLQPGRPQAVRVLYRRPGELNAGEYRSHLLFQQVPKSTPATAEDSASAGLALEIRSIFGISIPVIVRHGELDSAGALTGIRGVSLDSGQPAVALTIERRGTASLRGDLVALADGEEVGRLNNVAVYLSTPSREIVVPLSLGDRGSFSGRRITIEYRERPKAGGAEIAAAGVEIP